MRSKKVEGESAIVVAAVLMLLAFSPAFAAGQASTERPAALPYIDAMDCVATNGTGACDTNDTGQWSNTATVHARNSPSGETEAVVKLRIEGKGDPLQYRLQQTIILTDDSGSMAWNDPRNLRFEAAKYFIDQLTIPDEVGFAIFADTLHSGKYAELRAPLTTDYEPVKGHIVGTSNGGTPMINGLQVANDELIPNKKAGYSWAILMLTDGCWNTGGDPQPEANRAVSEHIMMFNVGLYPDPNSSDKSTCAPELRKWSNESGGKYYWVQDPMDLRQVYYDIASMNGWGHSKDFAGSPPKSGESMISFKLTNDIEVVPGSFACGLGCVDPAPTLPSSIDDNNTGLRLEWKAPVSEMRIGQIWEVQFKVRAYKEDTKLPLNEPSESYVLYDRYDNYPGSRDALGQLYLRVIPSVPTAPVDLNGTYNVSKIDLAWSSPSSLGGTHPSILNYKIYKGAEPGKEQYYAMTGGSETTFADRVFVPKATYYYRVSAVNCMGEGSMSNEVNVTVPVSMYLPGPPEGVGAEPHSGTIVVTWQAPSNIGYSAIEGYNIYKGLAPGDAALFDRVGGNDLAYADHLARPGITYYYRVSAINSLGEGALSDEVPAEIPTDEPGYNVQLHSIRLTIKDADTLQPIESASVLFGGIRKPLVSDGWGHLLLSNVSDGVRRLSVSANGYEPTIENVTVQGSDIELTIYLEKVYVPPPQVNSPPKVDDVTISVILLDVILAELALIIIIYFRVRRRLERTGQKGIGPHVRRGPDRKLP